ncbi:hypothetical protein C5167_018852 [Papaver somniferum]|uniref:Uncharacterized protein n=1 Tax=Papaver somniferum TaxID=3469 RepID=A0A4Y7ISE9_PAPSO|nr:hypothetical protein C5167_018852 [Papaver somniferum]
MTLRCPTFICTEQSDKINAINSSSYPEGAGIIVLIILPRKLFNRKVGRYCRSSFKKMIIGVELKGNNFIGCDMVRQSWWHQI